MRMRGDHIIEMTLPPFIMSQKTRILLPVLLGSNQCTALFASTPSLALISEQDSPGSSGIEPSGT